MYEKNIAILTGATGGIGKAFIPLLLLEVDEIWAIARNQAKLKLLRAEFGDKIIPISKDLSNLAALNEVYENLKMENPTVLYLINNAGIAKMGRYNDFSFEEITNTTSINCNTPVILSTMCIPFMCKGSHILNISSAAAFQPLPYLSLYSSSKAFLRYYSRALNVELKEKGITVTAVCPSWVDTELLTKEVNGKPIKFDKLVSATSVANKAMCDAKKGKDMSVCTAYVKTQHVLAKIFPQKMSMRTWIYKIRKLK